MRPGAKLTPIDPALVSRLSGGAPGAPGGQPLLGADGRVVDRSTWFGPLDPLPPVAPDAVAGRQLDYPAGWNLLVSPRGDAAVGPAALRALADGCDLVRLAIETRKDQLAALDWSIRPRPRHGVVAGADDPRAAAAAAFLRMPDREHGWDEWVRMLVEDMLVIDAATIYLRRDRSGGLYSLDLVDGGTIKRVIDDYGRTPAPPAPAYQQILKGLPATDYTTDDLLYLPRNPRTDRLYGLSPVEQVLLTVNIALRRQLHKLEYYTEGSQPDAFFGVPPDWTTEQLRQYQEYWDGLFAGNTAQRRQLKFIHGDVRYVPTKEAILKDEFDEWLARVVCFAFSISPTPFIRQLNRSTAESQGEAALAEGLAPLMRWLKRVADRILGEVLGWPELELVWHDGVTQNPQVQAQVASAYVAAGIKTRNEVRAELGLAPLPGGDALTVAGPVAPLEQIANPSLAKADGDWDEDQHPRWPTGAPDSQGGQFAPKDAATGVAPSGPAVKPQASVPAPAQPSIAATIGRAAIQGALAAAGVAPSPQAPASAPPPSPPPVSPEAAAARAAAIAAVRQKAANCNGSLQCADEALAEAERLGIFTGVDMGAALEQFLAGTAAVGTGLAVGTTALAEASPEAFLRFVVRLIADESGGAPGGAPSVIKDGDGIFSVINWEGYPEGIPKPSGPFKLLQGDAYTAARRLGDYANEVFRRLNQLGKNEEVHHIQPIKFGGPPKDTNNMMRLNNDLHQDVTQWWQKLQRALETMEK